MIAQGWPTRAAADLANLDPRQAYSVPRCHGRVMRLTYFMRAGSPIAWHDGIGSVWKTIHGLDDRA